MDLSPAWFLLFLILLGGKSYWNAYRQPRGHWRHRRYPWWRHWS